jgi:RHH-type proline utilization regulon transcriptional repressor/proline dehydrogenase/delta 1-pyrroline-5-carboxylate dehydrogenase
MTVHASELEELTRLYGREIFARLEPDRPHLFTPGWFDERLMEWSMNHEGIKPRLFLFVDVLPILSSPRSISRHLREYFEQAGPHLPNWLRLGLRLLPEDGWAGQLLARTARASAQRLARRFIAGSNLAEALKAIADLRRRQLAFTVDRLGEATITEAEAEAARNDYLNLIEGLTREVNAWPVIDRIDRDDRGPIPRVNVSVKLSALYSQFDPIDPVGTSVAVRARLRPILRAARTRHAFVNIDMEQYAFKDLTLRIVRDVLEEDEFRDWSDVGIALQAYLKETEHDLRELAAWARRRGQPVSVRLVKGAYWDYETVVAAQEGWPVPVFTHKWETDANYEKLTRVLLQEHELLRPALASHNIRNLAHGVALARLLDLPPGRLELQMLYGMADPIKDALVSLGQRVRVYTPYGQLLPGMAYLVRRLLENTANESFLRASFTEHVSEEQLLMNPQLRMRHAEGDPRNGNGSLVRRAHSAFRNEPLTDFSQEGARLAMQQSLAGLTPFLGHRYPLVIGGRQVRSEAAITSINPSHQRQVVGECDRATAAHVAEAIGAAREAFSAWREVDAERRADYLFRAAEVMRRRRFELAAWQVLECGKQWREADADVAESIDYCEYYGQEMLRLSQPRRRDLPGEENVYCYEPRGVAVVIAPWNFPLAILCGMSTAALVTGNTVILKPAEQSCIVAAKLMEVFQEVSLPPGVVNFLPGVGEEIGPLLVGHPEVALIAFTGSKSVGLAIYQSASATPPGQHHVKRVIAEMGGKNAIIIDDDADLDEAVQGVVRSAFGYQGQKCSACSRAIVLEPLYDVFLARLIEASRSLKIAPAEDPGCVIGPVIDAEARDRILAFIEKGKQEARLAYAGDVGALADEGFYVAPHIFADVPPDAVIAQEEIFGPVLAVMKARDLTDALALANGTPYALTGGLFSRSPENIERVKRQFRVGNLYINRKITGALVDRQPFGGFKLSGMGSKAGGPDYLLQFLLPRTITENTLRRGFAPDAVSRERSP